MYKQVSHSLDGETFIKSEFHESFLIARLLFQFIESLFYFTFYKLRFILEGACVDASLPLTLTSACIISRLLSDNM